MKVEIWSDVVCPWCYIGKRRFETAVARFDGAADIDLVWRSFQLNPTQPRGVRESHDEHLRQKMGATPEQVEAMNELGCPLGQGYHFSRPLTAGDAVKLLLTGGRPSTEMLIPA